MIEELCLVIGDLIGVGGNSVKFGAVVLNEGGPALFQEGTREDVTQVAVGLIRIRTRNKSRFPQGDFVHPAPLPPFELHDQGQE